LTLPSSTGIIPEPQVVEELVLDLSELKLANPSSEIVCFSLGNKICFQSNDDPSDDVDKFFPEKEEDVGSGEERLEDFLKDLETEDNVFNLIQSINEEPLTTLDVNDITDWVHDIGSPGEYTSKTKPLLIEDFILMANNDFFFLQVTWFLFQLLFL
jgi:hypothetical protein